MSQKTLIMFGYHSLESPRHINLSNLYRKEGYMIRECRTEVKGFFKKCRDVRRKWKKAVYATPDDHTTTMLVTFPGQYMMLYAWFLTRRPRRTVILDALISQSDTLVSDRKMYSWLHPFAWFLYLIDIVSCHLADTILVDTEAHKKFFASRFFLKKERIRVVYVGTRDDLFFPGEKESKLPSHKYNVLFYGSYIPLQGIEYILDAAQILQGDTDIHFTLIGSGQTEQAMRKKAADLHLSNVTFLPFQPIEELPSYIQSADICLGIFGKSDKADRVIPHKVYDGVACGIPVITAANKAIGEQFTDGKEVFLCTPGDGASLAEKVQEVKASIEDAQ